MQTNRGFVPILAIVIVAAVVLGGGYYVYQLAGGDVSVNLPPLERGNNEGSFTTDPSPTSPQPSTPKPTEPVACTMEAKICPDGSAVGRTGPNCEFAACAIVSATTTISIKICSEGEKFTSNQNFIKGQVIVLFKGGVSQQAAEKIIVDLGYSSDERVSWGVPFLNVLVPVGKEAESACKILSNSNVVSVEPNFVSSSAN